MTNLDTVASAIDIGKAATINDTFGKKKLFVAGNTTVERNTTGLMESLEEKSLEEMSEEEQCRVAMWRCFSRFT